MGKLQGIKLTTEISSLIDKVVLLPQLPCTSESKNDNPIQPSTEQIAKNDKKSSSLVSSPSASLARAKEARRVLSSSSLTTLQARSLLESATQNDKSIETKNNGESNTQSAAAHLPLAGVQALKFLIQNSECEPTQKAELMTELEKSLRQTSLSFPSKQSNLPSNTTTSAEETSQQKRMNRLKLLDEERSYNKLTTNLKDARSLKDDNITAKSMMYATSVGLNMIVAPITFGVFMFFFAGSILDRFFDQDSEDSVSSSRNTRGPETDIRRVIAGVVSGVFMLFVEMILFVIRSHELDASVRKKAKRRENHANPFGYTERTAAKVYTRDD